MRFTILFLALLLTACSSDPTPAADVSIGRDGSGGDISSLADTARPDIPARDLGGDRDAGPDPDASDLGEDLDADPVDTPQDAETGDVLEDPDARDVERDPTSDADAPDAPDADADLADADAPDTDVSDVSRDLSDVPRDVEPDAEPDASPDADPDVPEDAPDTDVPEDVEPDVDPDTPPDAPDTDVADAEPDVGPFCGDGTVDPGEECDDGNEESGDGCFECLTEGSDEIFLQLRDVPLLADRVFVSLDGGGLPEPSVFAQEIGDDPVVHIRYAVAGGGTFRVRALAVVGSGFPSVLAGGRIDAVAVPDGGAIGGVIDLVETTIELLPPTPDSATVAMPYEISVRVTDPANAFDGRSGGRLWVSDEPFSDLSASQHGGPMGRDGVDAWAFATTLVAGNPNVPRTTYYQFGESANGFEFDGEVPFIVRPSVRAGETLFEVDVLPSQSGINVELTGIPEDATQVYLSIDGGVLSDDPLRIDGPTGVEPLVITVAVPAGEDYRVRAIATVGEGSFPIVLAGGFDTEIDVPTFPFVDVTIPLVPPTVELVTPTPEEVTLGHPFTLFFEVTDPADFLEDVSSARVYSATEPPSRDLSGDSTGAPLSRPEPGLLTASADMSPVTEGTTFYFQLAESAGGDFGRDGTIAPFIALPSLAAGEDFLSLPVVEPAEGIEATFSGVPDDATLLVVVVDGGVDPGRYEIAVTGAEFSARLPVPVGTDYRVRAIAIRAPSGFPPVLAGGFEEAVDVVVGSYTSVTIPMGRPSITLSPETPSSAGPSSAVTIQAELYDPAMFLDGRGSARLWSRMTTFPNLSADQSSGSLTPTDPGFYNYSITITTPAERGTLYYQIGESAGSPWGTPAWAPFWVLPDVVTGSSLFEMTIE